jgi:hypothetical protein
LFRLNEARDLVFSLRTVCGLYGTLANQLVDLLGGVVANLGAGLIAQKADVALEYGFGYFELRERLLLGGVSRDLPDA